MTWVLMYLSIDPEIFLRQAEKYATEKQFKKQ